MVICLNVGVDPPDVTKTQPCARVECWVDPLTLNPQRALEAIGNNLQRQYERWQPRARYRQSLDPTVEEVRRLATGLRRNARDERVLFHYNGHGVPKPTGNLLSSNYLSAPHLASWFQNNRHKLANNTKCLVIVILGIYSLSFYRFQNFALKNWSGIDVFCSFSAY